MTKPKNIDNVLEDLELIKHINFSHEDAFNYIERFLYDEKAFIFLDPPYLFSDNKSYSPQRDESDNTDYYIKLISILNNPNVKAKIMLIINDLKILRFIFKDYIKGDYGKIYQLSNKKSTSFNNM